MSDLNQYSLSQTIGSTMKPIGPSHFGNFGLLGVTSSSLAAREVYASRRRTTGFSLQQDRLVAQAFEDVRDGASPDSLLWDKHLVRQYLQRCRTLGLDANDAALARRVVTIRKNKKRFADLGIRLTPTTRTEPQLSIVPKYAHLVEFALVRLRYRYGASIDEILLEPFLGDQFENLCLQSAPELSPQQVRLAALYIRKTRFLEKKNRSAILALDLSTLESRWTPPSRLSDVDPTELPEEPGMFEICEKKRLLFVANVDELQTPIAGLQDEAGPLTIVASQFWHPEPQGLSVRYLVGKKVEGVSMRHWEHRLIHDLRPTLNWPILDKAA